ILKENLREGLGIVGRIAQKNLSLPILNSVLLSCEKSFLCLKATDLEMGMKWWVLSKVEKEGKIACSLRVLQSLIDSLPSEKLSLKTEEKRLLLEADGFQAQINGLDAEEFPIIPEPEDKISFVIKNSRFIEGLSQVVEMAATSLVKPEISGVHFNFKENRLKMVATDSFRLAEKTILLDNQLEKEASFILPQRACREIINAFGGKEEDLRFYLSPNQVIIESLMMETPHPRIQFFTRLIEGEYPNYQEIIPKEFRFKVFLQKGEFLQRLKTVSLFSNKINEIKIKIRPTKQEMEIEGQNPEVGRSNSVFSAQIEGEKEAAEISFNWRFLVDGLNQIRDKEFVFALSKNEGPAVLKSKEEAADYLYLLMPLRI
ncbi:MAG: DNA polymerase III subunit beta, partial [Candidatus Nealsonbacteria bacterium]|nr:DNA polymerase III subunit beta [Candidatus Nealsonbacteria bacterium]